MTNGNDDVIIKYVVNQVRGLNESRLTNWHIPLCIWIARIAKIKVGWIIIELNRDYKVKPRSPEVKDSIIWKTRSNRFCRRTLVRTYLRTESKIRADIRCNRRENSYQNPKPVFCTKSYFILKLDVFGIKMIALKFYITSFYQKNDLLTFSSAVVEQRFFREFSPL